MTRLPAAADSVNSAGGDAAAALRTGGSGWSTERRDAELRDRRRGGSSAGSGGGDGGAARPGRRRREAGRIRWRRLDGHRRPVARRDPRAEAVRPDRQGPAARAAGGRRGGARWQRRRGRQRAAAAADRLAAAAPAERHRRARRCSRSIARARRRPTASRARTRSNCCGQVQFIGFRNSVKTQFQTLEAQCDLTYPLCGCPARQPTADDGSRLRFTDQAGVTCLQGKCTTFVPDCGQPCGAGTTCFSCIESPAPCSRRARRRAPTATRASIRRCRCARWASSGNTSGKFCTAAERRSATPGSNAAPEGVNDGRE